MCCDVVRWLSANLSLWTHVAMKIRPGQGRKCLHFHRPRPLVVVGGPRFPGLGQAKARQVCLHCQNVGQGQAKPGSVNTTKVRARHSVQCWIKLIVDTCDFSPSPR